jgi:hypothetical protein
MQRSGVGTNLAWISASCLPPPVAAYSLPFARRYGARISVTGRLAQRRKRNLCARSPGHPRLRYPAHAAPTALAWPPRPCPFGAAAAMPLHPPEAKA